jgi:cholesterol oxidase
VPSAAASNQGAVLLLHGGNTSSETFLLPGGGFAEYLRANGWDVWLLDWRASPHVLEDVLAGTPLGGSEQAERRLFTLDRVVDEDIPAAVRAVREQIGATRKLSILGHCVGGGALSIAIARGKLEAHRVHGAVLCTLGLFYAAPWNGWLKAEDFIIERVLGNTPRCRDVDPKQPESWPADMKEAFARWPNAWLPEGSSPAAELLRRLSFMLGQPYAPERLDPSISGDELLRQFGPMHLGVYQHLAQMVRRGYAAEFDALDVIDRRRTQSSDAMRIPPPSDHDLRPGFFHDKRVTLIAAAENQVWHRDSIDLMYDWLRRIDTKSNAQSPQFRKKVFRGYRIQELFWGRDARADVYPEIAKAFAA